MSTGIGCTGKSHGLGTNCEPYGATPETRLCGPCIKEAKSLGREVVRYTLLEQLRYGWGGKDRSFRGTARQWGHPETKGGRSFRQAQKDQWDLEAGG